MISLKPEKFTRYLIEAAVNRGIKEMQEDPKRSVRKLADLGRQFARGRFQKNFFTLSQTLLLDDNSPYYSLLSRLTEEIDHETLKKFGINIGYTSWTYGAQLIRAYEREHGLAVPWSLFIHYHPEGAFCLSRLEALIQEGRSLGIYTYCLCLEAVPEDWQGLISLFRRYDNSAFLLFLPDEELQEEDVLLLSQCRNLLLSAEIAPSYRNNISLLRQNKCLAANHYYYSDSGGEELLLRLKDCESPLLFFLPQKDTPPSARERLAESIYQIRYHPEHPVFPIELFADYKRIDYIISDRTCFLEIDSEGRIPLPGGASLCITQAGFSLPDLLQAAARSFFCEAPC